MAWATEPGSQGHGALRIYLGKGRSPHSRPGESGDPGSALFRGSEKLDGASPDTSGKLAGAAANFAALLAVDSQAASADCRLVGSPVRRGVPARLGTLAAQVHF